MEALTFILHQAGNLGPVVTTALLAVLAFERAIDRGWIRLGKAESSNLPRLMKQLLEQQGILRHHFNDETTAELKSIALGQQELITLLKEGFNRIIAKFDEYDKYGIRVNAESCNHK